MEHWLIAFCLVSIALLIAIARRARRYASDVARLRRGIRAVLRREPVPPGLSFHDSALRDIWRMTTALHQQSRSVERSRSTIDEVLSLSSSIAEASDDTGAAAEALANMLANKIGPDVAAIAVVLRDSVDSDARVEASHGVPRQRIEQPLLICFDRLLEGDEDVVSWGYHLPERGSLFDFSVFGVGLSLAVPLRDRDGVCGGIWVGFRVGSRSLTAERKAFLHAITCYAAACFYAAGKAKQRREQSDSERNFLLGMSHDLRAPGNSALYALRDLLSGETGVLSEEQHLRLTVAERSLEQQLQLLGDVLDFAKYQRGFLETRKRSFGLDGIVREMVDRFSLSMARQELSLVVDPLPDCFLHADPQHVQRILSNYLSNALKYTETGEVRISFRRTDAAIEVLVIDSGMGVPADEVAHLFTEFRRCANATSRDGVGLGLALSKVLAELNGGYTFYEPRAEGGSIFGVGLPLLDDWETESSSQQIVGSILVIDDDPAACRTNIRYLQELADTLIPANSVEDARTLFQTVSPDLLVTDVRLGTQSIEELLDELFPEQLPIPLVVVSAAADPELRKRLESRGAIVLEKPVSREALQAAVRQAISDEFRTNQNASRMVNGAHIPNQIQING